MLPKQGNGHFNKGSTSVVSKMRSSCSTILRGLTLPATVLGVGYVTHSGIQASRVLDASVTKDTIKNTFSRASGVVHLGAMVYTGISLVQAGSECYSQLTVGQKLIIASMVLTGVVGSVYSMVNFGVEQTTLSSAYAAAASSLLFTMAARGMQYYAHCNQEEVERRQLSSEQWSSY